jgi:hypothetical protein
MPEGGGAFMVRLAVDNTGREAFADWRLEFRFGGAERVTTVDGARWHQTGHTVSLTGDIDLPPGLTAAAVLHGDGGRPGYSPSNFALNGTACISQVNFDPPPGGPPPPPDGDRPGGAGTRPGADRSPLPGGPSGRA